MFQFFVKRFIGLLFVVIGVTFITFIMGFSAPGDPIVAMMGLHPNPQEYHALKHIYGLDLPWWQQYYNYLQNLFTFNLGLSYAYKSRAVSDLLASGVPISLELGFWALLIDLLLGIPLGIISALRANTWVDSTNMTLMLIVYALPTFVLAYLIQAFILWFDNITGIGWPVSQWGNPWQYSWSDIQFKLAPILVYAATGVAYFARLSRTAMLEVLRQDYIRTARSKGLREQIVIYRHALRNAMIPLVTVIGVITGFLVTGAYFIEHIFNIPGIAEITLTSISNRDYPVIQATTVLLAVAVVCGNLLSDLLYVLVDPRIKIA